MNKEKYFEKAHTWAQRKAIDTIKSVSEGYEDPKVFVNQTSKEEIQADMSFITSGGAKHYTDIALKEDNVSKLVTRWKLLSMMATAKRGKLHLLTPKGHKMFAQKTIDKYNISAVIHSI